MDNLIAQNHIHLFKKAIKEAHKIVLIPHINPDGDAIGSCLAFWHILKNIGKDATVIIPNNYPDFLYWLEGSDHIVDFEKTNRKAKGIIKSADTIFILDFNDFERSAGLVNILKNFEGNKIMIDHHPEPEAACDLVLSYPEISSTCELLFRLIERAGLLPKMDKNAADSVFTGMMTDTGNFSYNASDPETYRIIASLLEKGIDKDLIHSNVYHTFSADRWRLIGHCLKNKMVILPEYQTGYISLTKSELDRFNFQPGDTEGLVNYPLMVKDIKFCALLMEKDDIVKMSFRSKGNFSTNDFARAHFNGGGHINASGGSSELSMEKTIANFESLLPCYKDQLLNSF